MPRGGLPLRLAPDVEAFPASDGAIYFLRGGPDAIAVVEDAGPRDRAIVAALAEEPLAPAALAAAVERAGVPCSTAHAAEAVAALAGLGLLAAGPPDGDGGDRYARQRPYLDAAAGPEGQRRLGDARVAVIGVGGLGSWVAAGLACAGVGALTIVDDDRVSLTNLNRQVTYRLADLGRRKVDALRDWLAGFNPDVEVRTAARRVRGPADVAFAAAGADLVVEAADWPAHLLSRWIDAACLDLGVPHLGAAQVPPTIRVGPLHVPGQTGCVTCEEAAARRAFPLYDELARFRAARPGTAATIGPAAAAAGSLVAMEAVHWLAGAQPVATEGAAWLLDLRTFAVSRHAVERDPHCPSCGPVAALAS